MTLDPPCAFLRRLVATPSLSGDEAAAVSVFVDEARRLGLEAHVDEAGNGEAWRGGGGSLIALLGHIDTVPGDIPVRVDGEGRLWGRGSVDAKGPLAAMLVAAAAAELPPGVEVRVIAAVGEESPNSPGACAVRERLRPAACIIGEPSGVGGVTLGYKGRLLCRAVCETDAAHSAGPDGSPGDALFAWWGRVLEATARMSAGRDGVFDVIQCSVQGLSSGGDGLRDHAALRTGFRLPTWITPAELEAVCRDAAEGLLIELEFDGRAMAHRSGRADAVARALTGAIRAAGMRPRPKVKTGTSDMNVVTPVWRCPIAAYGPGDSGLDHAPDERVSLDEYRASIAVLTHAIGSLAAELAGATPGPK